MSVELTDYVYDLHDVIETSLKVMASTYLDGATPERAMAAAIASAINKWPDQRMIYNALSGSPKYVKLPVEGISAALEERTDATSQ